jgi:hypothetical protein
LVSLVPIVGAVVTLGGWLIAAIAGVGGGYLAADRGGLTQNDGLKAGALFAAIGNAAAAFVGIAITSVVNVVFSAVVREGLVTTTANAPELGGLGFAGFAVVGALVGWLVGLVSGTAMAGSAARSAGTSAAPTTATTADGA